LRSTWRLPKITPSEVAEGDSGAPALVEATDKDPGDEEHEEGGVTVNDWRQRRPRGDVPGDELMLQRYFSACFFDSGAIVDPQKRKETNVCVYLATTEAWSGNVSEIAASKGRARRRRQKERETQRWLCLRLGV
jgi:hypothetical protein